MEAPQINNVSKRLNHGGGYPDTHIFLRVKSRHILWCRFENSEYWENELPAHRLPEVKREIKAICFESVEKCVQSPRRISNQYYWT